MDKLYVIQLDEQFFTSCLYYRYTHKKHIISYKIPIVIDGEASFKWEVIRYVKVVSSTPVFTTFIDKDERIYKVQHETI